MSADSTRKGMPRQSHSKRGMELEGYVTGACRTYRNRGEALIVKIATPFRNVGGRMEYDEEGNGRWAMGRAIPDPHADTAVDYVGIRHRHYPVGFDCKESHVALRFDLDRVDDEQVRYMNDFEQMGGVCFLLIRQVDGPGREAIHLLPFRAFYRFWEEAGRARLVGSRPGGARQSIPIDEIRRWPQANAGRGVVVDFLPALDRALTQWEMANGQPYRVV